MYASTGVCQIHGFHKGCIPHGSSYKGVSTQNSDLVIMLFCLSQQAMKSLEGNEGLFWNKYSFCLIFVGPSWLSPFIMCYPWMILSEIQLFL